MGTACLVLPLVWPRYCFPLVWGAGFFLLDPFVKLLGGRSLIQAWLDGERREHLCLLAAGLLCGLWWEAWNYGATAKWVYTLPVLNFGKIFEMPVLGYLGFPPFALECAVMYNFMQVLDERVLVTARRCRYAVVIQLALLDNHVCGDGCPDGDFVSVGAVTRTALVAQASRLGSFMVGRSPRRNC